MSASQLQWRGTDPFSRTVHGPDGRALYGICLERNTEGQSRWFAKLLPGGEVIGYAEGTGPFGNDGQEGWSSFQEAAQCLNDYVERGY